MGCLVGGWKLSLEEETKILSVPKRGIAPETSGLSVIEFPSPRNQELLTDAVIDQKGKI